MNTILAAQSYPITIDGKDATVLVRPNNDGWAIWYVFVILDCEELDIPSQFTYIHGSLDVGFDEDPELFANARESAIAEARKVVDYYNALASN